MKRMPRRMGRMHVSHETDARPRVVTVQAASGFADVDVVRFCCGGRAGQRAPIGSCRPRRRQDPRSRAARISRLPVDDGKRRVRARRRSRGERRKSSFARRAPLGRYRDRHAGGVTTRRGTDRRLRCGRDEPTWRSPTVKLEISKRPAAHREAPSVVERASPSAPGAVGVSFWSVPPLSREPRRPRTTRSTPTRETTG
jgi:hypothetical protein